MKMKKRSKKASPPVKAVVNNNGTSDNENKCIDQFNNSIQEAPLDTGENIYMEKENHGINDSSPVQNADTMWPDEDVNELITRMEKCIPENDALAYSKRADKLDWDQIAFSKYSNEQCRQQWNLLQKHVRRFRLLSEIITDAREWLKNPQTKKGKGKIPDMPRRPHSSYMIFYLKKKNKILREHPGIGAHEITKIAASLYKALTPDKKEKYDALAVLEKEEYANKLQQFYELHPEHKPKISEKSSRPLKIKPAAKGEKAPKISKQLKTVKGTKVVDVKPEKPKSPFLYYMADELKKLGNKDVDKNVFKEECREKWKNMPDKKKVFWINWAEKCDAEYEEQVKTYVQSHPTFIPQPHKNILNKEETLLKERIAGKPVKPPNSAYSLFSKKLLSSNEIKSVDPRERMNYLGLKWKNLSDEEKNKYKQEHDKASAEYKAAYDLYLQSLPEDKRQEELEKTNLKRKLKPADEKSESKKNPKKKRKKETKIVKRKFKEPETPPISVYKYFVTTHKGSGNPSSAWKSLSAAEKKKCEEELMVKKREYIVNFEKFLKSLTKEELEEYSKARKQIPRDEEDVGEEAEDEESSNSSSGSEDSEEDKEDNSDAE